MLLRETGALSYLRKFVFCLSSMLWETALLHCPEIKSNWRADRWTNDFVFRSARNYDLNQAESMLRTSLNWKEKNKIDELVETFQTPEALTKFFPLGQIGRDKLGCSRKTSASIGAQRIHWIFNSVNSVNWPVVFFSLLQSGSCLTDA